MIHPYPIADVVSYARVVGGDYYSADLCRAHDTRAEREHRLGAGGVEARYGLHRGRCTACAQTRQERAQPATRAVAALERRAEYGNARSRCLAAEAAKRIRAWAGMRP